MILVECVECFSLSIKIGFFGCSQRDMNSSVYYKLDKNLDGNRIIQDIKNLLSGRENLSNSILEIRIKTINHTDTSMIPKIEYKP